MSWTYPAGFDATTAAAITRDQSYYNNTAYDPSTNPGGFRPGSAGAGHLVNFIPALGDTALAVLGAGDAAFAAGASAAAAAVSETNAAASAAKLAGTSTTSISIGTGSKGPFTTQSGKFFNVGAWLNIRSAANPTINYMIGQVTAYSGTSLTVSVPAGATGGSGTFTDWTIELSAAPGQAGAMGATGTRGPSPAIQWTFSDGITDSDPGNGLFKLSSATLSAATFIYFDNLNIDSIDVTTWLDALDDSTNTADRGRIYMQKYTSPDKFVTFKVTGAVIDGTGYRKVPVTLISASAASVPFAAADIISIDFSPTGNKGADGAGAGDVVGPAIATDGAIALFDTTTGKLIKDSAKGIGTSGANVGVLNANNTYSGTSSFTGTFAWSSTAIGTVANANALTVGRQGSTNPALNVDTATSSCVTGLKITAAAAAAGLALAVISSGTDENLTIDAKGAGTITLNATGTGAIQHSRNAVPTASDGAALGTTALMWSDLFLASGAVIDLNNGDVTITHSANLLAHAGASSGYTFDNLLIVGTTASLSVNGNADNLQVWGSSAATGGMTLGMSNATAGTCAHLDFYRSKNASIGSATVVASGDALGKITFFGAQQTGTFATQNPAAEVRAEVDGTVTSGASADMPGRLIFATTADGSGTLTDQLKIDSAGLATFTGPIKTTDATAASSTTTGSGIFAGGIGVAGSGYIGSSLFVTSTVTDPLASHVSGYALNAAAPFRLNRTSGTVQEFGSGANPSTLIAFFYTGGGGQTAIGSITGTTTNTAYNTSSDERMKFKINASSIDWGDVVDRAPVDDFEFKDRPGHPLLGFIAQRLYPVFPQAVTKPEDEDDDAYWQVDYGMLSPLALWGVKNLRSRVAVLEAELASLKSRLH